MRRLLVKTGTACLTLLVGVTIGSLHQRFSGEKSPSTEKPGVNPELYRPETPHPSNSEAEYPEELGITPYEIESFINQNPVVNLARLWERLGIRNDDDSAAGVGHVCGGCEARSFRYNLDGDAYNEIVLRIRSLAQSDTYLIFKSLSYKESELLGHADAWSKYTPQDPVVLLSGGRAWLVIQSTAATGSGLSAWTNTIYQVSSRGVKPVLTYLYELNQSGGPDWPSKQIVGHLESCEIEGDRATATVSYAVEYSGYGNRGKLFDKKQTAVLVSSLRQGDVVLDRSRSTIGNHEFDNIYQVDSMGEDDFLTYNRSELRSIAVGHDSKKKQWLREFLDTCRDSRIKRELSSLITL